MGLINNAKEALVVLYDNEKARDIDGNLVAPLNEHYEEIDRLHEEATQNEGRCYYQSINKKLQ